MGDNPIKDLWESAKFAAGFTIGVCIGFTKGICKGIYEALCKS